MQIDSGKSKDLSRHKQPASKRRLKRAVQDSDDEYIEENSSFEEEKYDLDDEDLNEKDKSIKKLNTFSFTDPKPVRSRTEWT